MRSGQTPQFAVKEESLFPLLSSVKTIWAAPFDFAQAKLDRALSIRAISVIRGQCLPIAQHHLLSRLSYFDLRAHFLKTRCEGLDLRFLLRKALLLLGNC